MNVGRRLRGAFVAVDVFFVLSGFFLATTLTRRLANGVEIRPGELVARRVWRLLPPLVVVLPGTLATTLLYAPIDRAAVAERAVPVSAFVGNLAFAADGVNYFNAGENPLLHTWTLGVELQLVMLFPLLVMLFAAWGERRAGTENGAERRWIVMRSVLIGVTVTGAVSFVLAVRSNDSAPMWAYFGPHTRLWSFCAGAMMAFLTGGGQSAVGGSALRIGGVRVKPGALRDRARRRYPVHRRQSHHSNLLPLTGHSARRAGGGGPSPLGRNGTKAHPVSP